LWLTLAAAAWSQQPVAHGMSGPQAKPPPPEQVNTARLEAARKALEGANLGDEARQQAIALLDQAAESLRASEQATRESERLSALIKQAPERIEALRAKLAAPAAAEEDAAALAAKGDLERIQQRIGSEEPLQLQTQEQLKRKEEELSALLLGAKPLNEEIAQRLSSAQQIEEELTRETPGEAAELTQARTLSLYARHQQRQAEIKLLQLRLGNLDRLTTLAQVERDALAAENARRRAQLDSLRQAARQLREQQSKEALQQAEALQAKTAALPPEVAAIAQENTQLRLELDELTGKEKRVSEGLQQVREELAKINADYERVRRRVESVGLTESLGKLLRRYRADLPSLQEYRRLAKDRDDQISRVLDRQIEIDDLQRDSYDSAAAAQRVLAALPAPADAAALAQLEKETLTLMQARRETLNELQKVYGRYLGELSELNQAQQKLLREADGFVGYIDQQLLWIPSKGVIYDGVNLVETLNWFTNSDAWWTFWHDAGVLLKQEPVKALLVVLLVGGLLLLRPLAQRRMTAIAQATRKIRTDSFLLTLRACLLTLVLVAPLPLALMLLGFGIYRQSGASDFSLAVAAGLFSAGKMWIGFGLLLQMTRRDNLAERHLHWPDAVREALGRQLRWFTPLAVPMMFVIAASQQYNVPAAVETSGHLAFLLLCLAAALAMYLLLRGQGQVMQYLRQTRPRGWITQLHFLWFPVLLALFLGLAVTTGLGYYNLAANLGEQTRLTFWLFFALLVLRDLLLRGLFITERRLRLEDALRRREEQRTQRAKEGLPADGEGLPIAIEIPELDYDQLSEQTRRLVQIAFLIGALIGTWILWRELIPVLGALEKIDLPLLASRTVEGVVQQVPVTLADLLQGVVIAVVTVLAAKNLPGLLEMTILQRLPMESGARYAITALSQYSIAGIGFFAAFGSIGLEWSNIQWLVAALGVGVGFGLQEIVANFISGIILLFERPIRVGDVVTIGDVSGVVSRIRIRATTITNWDKQELIVPNKEFITGRLLNWTLTDSINRVIINVGAAYGSDVRKALALLLAAAEENESVLKDPKPFASFEGFGDNALHLVLRAYLGSMDNRLATISALHQAINDKFEAAGISIAFPQRDLHLFSTEPLDVRLHGAFGQEGEIRLRPAKT